MLLRLFHLVFVLPAIIVSVLFGAWAVWEHAHTHDPTTLGVGVFSFIFGFALIGYSRWGVRKFDAAAIK